MRFNATKETDVFYRKSKKEVVLKESSEIENVLEDIKKIKNNSEQVLIFSEGDTADFLYERSCVNDLSFNYFQIYNESTYNCLNKIKAMLKEICKIHEVSISKNLYFISSEYEEEFLEDFWYDSGGIRIPIFCGYWILESDEGSFMTVDENKIDLVPGTLVVFEAGKKNSFSNVKSAISFNISTLSKIKNQYPQKWMPL